MEIEQESGKECRPEIDRDRSNPKKKTEIEKESEKDGRPERDRVKDVQEKKEARSAADCKEPSLRDLRTWFERSKKRYCRERPKGSSSVLIPVLIRDGEYHVLYEVRSSKLGTQPGEICFPGGRIERGEDPEEAAVREAVEELCIEREQIEVIGALERVSGPGGTALHAYIGLLTGYNGSFSEDEVGQVFTLPLSWILENDPEIYRIQLERRMPGVFPYELVPGGRDYKWREQSSFIPFYSKAVPLFWEKGSGTAGFPVLWGATARVTWIFANFMRAGM